VVTWGRLQTNGENKNMPDSHMKLCISEHAKPTPLPCTECGKESFGFSEWVDGSGFICVTCCGDDPNWGEPVGGMDADHGN